MVLARFFWSRAGRAACGAAAATLGAAWGERAQAAPSPAASPQRLFIWGQAAVPRASAPQPPLEIEALRARGVEVRSVAFGSGFSAATDDKGQLWLWLGAQGSIREDAPGPWRVKLSERVTALAATDNSIVAVTSRGRALLLERVAEWSAAFNVPAGDFVTPAAPPRVLAGDASRRRIVSVAAGGSHALLLDDGGRLLAFGANGRGQLGLGGEPSEADAPVLEPRLVGGALAGRTVVTAACGERHSLCVTDEGRLFAFGDDRWLQLGLRDGGVPSIKRGPEMRAAPVEVDVLAVLRAAGHVSDASREPERWRVALVAAGGAHSLVALRSETTGETCVVACGNGRWGQLGDGQFKHISAPREVKGMHGLEEWDERTGSRIPISVCALAAGANHSAALLSTGDVLAWGDNALSQQGTGSRVGSPAPARVRALTGLPMGHLTCARNSCAAWSAAAEAAR